MYPGILVRCRDETQAVDSSDGTQIRLMEPMIGRRTAQFSFWLAGCAAALAVAPLASGQAPFRESVLPFEADAFDAQPGPDGTLHVVYSRRDRTFYTRRLKGKAGFEEVLEVVPGNAKMPPERKAGPPRLALGKGRRLHVLRQTKSGMMFATSADSGGTWTTAPVRDARAAGEVDMPALVAGPDGRVHVVWVDTRDGHPEDDRYAAHLYMASSADGAKFGPNHRLTSREPRACPCCQPALAIDGGGRLWVAYRSSEANIKETRLLIVAGGKIAGKRLSGHRWKFVGCPMNGPSLAMDGGQAALVWTSDGDLFTASSADGGRTFSPAERLGKGSFHAAAAGGPGVLIAWDEGPDTGWRIVGRQSGPRLPIKPEGKLIPEGGEFVVLRAPAR